jgi:hypothetical protein
MAQYIHIGGVKIFYGELGIGSNDQLGSEPTYPNFA